VSSWTGPRGAGEPRPTPAAPAEQARQTEQAEQGEAPAGHHLPAGAHLSDRRGLTATGAVALALALGIAGGLIDVLTGPGLRTVFAVCFVAGCGLAALTVHREDLVAAVVIPPIVYCVLALLAGAVETTVGSQSLLTRQLGAPVLLTATGLALAIAVVRGALGRRPA
jgi:hypothetical protein